MLNKSENQHYTKEDINFFNILSNFKKDYSSLNIDIIQNDSRVEEKYTINDHKNFNQIIKNQDTDYLDHIPINDSQKEKDLGYNKNDLKNFEKFDNPLHGYYFDGDKDKDSVEFSKIDQTNYKKNDLENFSQIIKSEQNNEKNSVKIVNAYERMNSKSKKENLNLKKIKILYFD